MDLEITIFSEVSQKDKDHMTLLTCGIYNTTQMNLSMKQKQSHRKAMPRNTHPRTTVLNSHATKVMLKRLQASFNTT